MSINKLTHKKIKQYSVSKYSLLSVAIFFLIGSYFMLSIKTDFITSLIILIVLGILSAKYVINYLNLNIVLTNRQIIIKNKFLKTNLKLDLSKELKYFRVYKKNLGLFLNYYTLEIVDINDNLYKFEHIDNAKDLAQLILENTKNYLLELGIDPKEIENN